MASQTYAGSVLEDFTVLWSRAGMPYLDSQSSSGLCIWRHTDDHTCIYRADTETWRRGNCRVAVFALLVAVAAECQKRVPVTVLLISHVDLLRLYTQNQKRCVPCNGMTI